MKLNKAGFVFTRLSNSTEGIEEYLTTHVLVHNAQCAKEIVNEVSVQTFRFWHSQSPEGLSLWAPWFIVPPWRVRAAQQILQDVCLLCLWPFSAFSCLFLRTKSPSLLISPTYNSGKSRKHCNLFTAEINSPSSHNHKENHSDTDGGSAFQTQQRLWSSSCLSTVISYKDLLKETL